ncbi:VOC family protein [Saccharopolyspora sp. TS4A08]|uniref:VOC family protein n=1 Tax=Saccharopolyspora ipomoeae TaxID=3042027 RepID=A0ABT6PX87_9PSEU|nr:VOC family protein [Saccharopolyspora sp. TS4A08]MDI2032612.1 VOC family protein [Saccharopolyspora sp. TS4A08]
MPLVVEFAAQDPARLARWWAEVLGWTVVDETGVRPDGPGVPLRFLLADRAKTGQNDVHLDLRSESHDEQTRVVERLFNHGARFADIGQSTEVPWVVMADVEGNELCALEPRKAYACTGPLAAVVVGTTDPREQARAWAEELDYDIVTEQPEFAALRPPSGEGPHLEFLHDENPRPGMLRILPG